MSAQQGVYKSIESTGGRERGRFGRTMEASMSEEGVEPQETSETARLTTPPPSSQGPPGFTAIAAALTTLLLVAYITFLSFQNGVKLFSFHPVCMSIGWLLLMTSAVNAFSPSDIAIQWMPIQNRTTRHWVLQVGALIFLTVGFIIIVTNKILLGKSHFTTLHGVFGLISLIMATLTATGGLGALYSLKFKKLIAPVYIKLTHGIIGIITYVLGIVTITLPFFSPWWVGGDVFRLLCIVALLLLMLFSILRPTVKIYARIRERINYMRPSN